MTFINSVVNGSVESISQNNRLNHKGYSSKKSDAIGNIFIQLY